VCSSSAGGVDSTLNRSSIPVGLCLPARDSLVLPTLFLLKQNGVHSGFRVAGIDERRQLIAVPEYKPVLYFRNNLVLTCCTSF